MDQEHNPDKKHNHTKTAAIVGAFIATNVLTWVLAVPYGKAVKHLELLDERKIHEEQLQAVKTESERMITEILEQSASNNIQVQLDKESAENQLTLAGAEDVKKLVIFPEDSLYIREGSFDGTAIKCLGALMRDPETGTAIVVDEECLDAAEVGSDPTPTPTPAGIKGLEGLPIIQTSVQRL